SYQYPDHFDIIVLRDNVTIKVREKRITAILPAADYVYDNVPVINGRGFAVLAQSNEDVQQFLKEYEAVRESEQTAFFAKWVRFDTYRKVIFPA
ncbi:MAG: sulfate adenylyltransferase, partial [Ruminococcus sp.]